MLFQPGFPTRCRKNKNSILIPTPEEELVRLADSGADAVIGPSACKLSRECWSQRDRPQRLLRNHPEDVILRPVTPVAGLQKTMQAEGSITAAAREPARCAHAGQRRAKRDPRAKCLHRL